MLAINFSNLPGQTLRTIAAGLFGVGWIGAFSLLPRRTRTMWWFLGAFVVVLAWWWFIPASNDRDWQPEFARMPVGTLHGFVVVPRDHRLAKRKRVTLRDVHGETFISYRPDLLAGRMQRAALAEAGAEPAPTSTAAARRACPSTLSSPSEARGPGSKMSARPRSNNRVRAAPSISDQVWRRITLTIDNANCDRPGCDRVEVSPL